jgi:hypothetical protein
MKIFIALIGLVAFAADTYQPPSLLRKGVVPNTSGSAAAPGADTTLPYNNAGVFAATTMTWNSATSTLSLVGSTAGCQKMYELAANGTNYYEVCAADAITDTYTVKPPIAAPAASQSKRCASYSGGVCQEEWFTPASTLTLNMPVGGVSSGGSTYPSAYWSIPSANGATANNQNISSAGQQAEIGLISFADAVTSYATISYDLPSGYQVAATASGRIRYMIGSGASAAQAARLSFETACIGNGDVIGAVAYNAADLVTSTISSATTAAYTITSATLNMTGCAANEKLVIRFSRIGGDGADTLTSRIDVMGFSLDVTVQ